MTMYTPLVQVLQLKHNVQNQCLLYATATNLSLYINEYRTPLSPRQPLIGSSRDFTREHATSVARKWSRSCVDRGFLIKVTRENSD